MKQTILFLVFIIIGFCAIAQTKADAVQKLEEVILVADSQLKDFTNSQYLQSLNDSIVKNNQPSLTSLLNYNSTIYFKENGLGMVSSASFRGTTAQQTTVVWNGININSQFNGQTDFNTINTKAFNTIVVRNGGGSVLYGSGAIGGSIHLNNTLNFKKETEHDVNISYGSFNTLSTNYNGVFSTNKLSLSLGLSYNSSDNDYNYLESNQKNLNGQFENKNAALNLGYKINDANLIKVYATVFNGDRNFSLILPSETSTKYKNLDTRSLLEWTGLYGAFTSKLKLAYLTERYKYFQNIERNSFTTGDINTGIIKYDLHYKLENGMSFNAIADFAQNKGNGSNIETVKRTVFGANLLFKHKLNSNFLYEITTRQEVTNNYKSPLLYSLGLRYTINKNYAITLNHSKNFRIPTFNDLYWEISGNQELKPETASQIEMGHVLKFNTINFSITGFYNDIKDMIRWLPADDGVWKPINTDEVITYGIESKLDISKRFNKHKLTFNSGLAYTVSQNKKTKKQLVYVPFYKITANLGYAYKKWSTYYQYLYVGDVFTSSNNDPKFKVDDYFVSNIGADYTLGKKNKYTLGVQVNNMFNENYQSVASRFMPGRHYNFYINFNF